MKNFLYKITILTCVYCHDVQLIHYIIKIDLILNNINS